MADYKSANIFRTDYNRRTKEEQRVSLLTLCLLRRRKTKSNPCGQSLAAPSVRYRYRYRFRYLLFPNEEREMGNVK